MIYPLKLVAVCLVSLCLSLNSLEAVGRPLGECIHAEQPASSRQLSIKAQSEQAAAVALEIHGFALQKGAFASLSQVLNNQGVLTEAIDVTGFGAKSNSLLDFDLASSEIIERLDSIHKSNPSKKVFLVGESMGGALALVVAAKRPDLVDGVIASEPAYKITVNPLIYPTVFFNLLIRPDAPIKIPTGFAKRVTRCEPFLAVLKEEILEQRGYSARELWRFRSLMKQVPGAVKQLTQTPILFLQGDRDRLVSPSGTGSLSKLATEARHNLVSFHNREHLLLEEEQADAVVVSSVEKWIYAVILDEEKSSHLPIKQVYKVD